MGIQIPHIRIIGDVHGLYGTKGGRNYKNLIQKPQYTVQVGDFGFDYSVLEKVDSQRHRIIAGNHDNYEAIATGKYPHFLGDFGMHSIPLENDASFNFFFVRGAFSVDKWARSEYRDWWPQEELNFMQTKECIAAYEKARPRIVMSHECPEEIVPLITRSGKVFEPSNTQKLLQLLYRMHEPKIWIFGHHHRSWRHWYTGRGVMITGREIDNGPRNGTLFICLDELGYCDFDAQGEILPGMPR